MEANLIEKGLELMIVGMGTTFLFLITLVSIMGVLKKLVEYLNKHFPENVPAPAASAPVQNNAKIALAIAAAKHFAK